jgi:hypothetical protein
MARTRTTIRPDAVGVRAADLGRRFKVDVTANGAVLIRDMKQPGAKMVGLPVYSTDTHEEAQSLITLRCRLARDRSGTYQLKQLRAGDIAKLDDVAAMFRADHKRTKGSAHG